MQQPGFLDENGTRGGAHLEGCSLLSPSIAVKKKRSHQQLQPDIPALEQRRGEGEEGRNSTRVSSFPISFLVSLSAPLMHSA